jgi:hypothetical protein
MSLYSKIKHASLTFEDMGKQHYQLLSKKSDARTQITNEHLATFLCITAAVSSIKLHYSGKYL